MVVLTTESLRDHVSPPPAAPRAMASRAGQTWPGCLASSGRPGQARAVAVRRPRAITRWAMAVQAAFMAVPLGWFTFELSA